MLDAKRGNMMHAEGSLASRFPSTTTAFPLVALKNDRNSLKPFIGIVKLLAFRRNATFPIRDFGSPLSKHGV